MHIDRFERSWLIVVSIVLTMFFAALLAGAVIYSVRLPSPAGTYNPLRLNETEFASPGLRLIGETDTGRPYYEAHIVARRWNFDAGTTETLEGKPVMRVPVGAEVTFLIAAEDITHGFMIERHNLNVMAIPGQIARQSTTFDRPGRYAVLCHEYCGAGHQDMWMWLVVEDNTPTTTANHQTDD